MIVFEKLTSKLDIKKYLDKKAAIEIETILKIVLVLAVLIILIFLAKQFTGQSGGLAEKLFSNVPGN